MDPMRIGVAMKKSRLAQIQQIKPALKFIERIESSPGRKGELGWLLSVDTHSDEQTGKLVFLGNERQGYDADFASNVSHVPIMPFENLICINLNLSGNQSLSREGVYETCTNARGFESVSLLDLRRNGKPRRRLKGSDINC